MKSKRLFGVCLLLYMLMLLMAGILLKTVLDDVPGEYITVEAEPITVYNEPVQSTTEYIEVYYMSRNIIEEQEVVVEDYIVEVPEVLITNHRGVQVWTSPVTVNVTQLLNSYNRVTDEVVDWDEKNKLNVLNTLWEFLVMQQGIDPIYASAIMGNIAIEGTFGQEQGTYEILASIEDANNILNNSKGYGICQWTFKTRKQDLLTYYNTVYEITGDWETTLIIAECCMLLEECKAMKLFDDIYYCTSDNLEHATGVIAVEYEGYYNSKKQWSKTNGEYCLISTLGSGEERLGYAENVYEHYTKPEGSISNNINCTTIASAVY